MKNEFTPVIFEKSNDALQALTTALGVPREILPSSKDIVHVLNELPELLSNMKEEIRDEKIVKLCLASGVGLFDAAINYIWDQTVIELRKKVIEFGLDIVSEIKGKKIEEKNINEMQDSDLLLLCSELMILDDEAFYYLSQCRDMRNNCSAAHPAIGSIDKYELENYINRCTKYVLSFEHKALIGINFKELLSVLNTSTFSHEQLVFWKDRIESTNIIQKSAIFKMLHGKYCDPRSSSTERANIISLSKLCITEITDKAKSEIIDAYNEYVSKNEEKKRKASEEYITNVGLFDILSITTQHSIISRLCKQLYNVHYGINNFYNEPAYASYLHFISSQTEIPDSVKQDYVDVVVNCGVGNCFGVSNGAEPYYIKMVEDFSPREVAIMINLQKTNSYFASLIRNNKSCRDRYKALLQKLQISLLPPDLQAALTSLLKTL